MANWKTACQTSVNCRGAVCTSRTGKPACFPIGLCLGVSQATQDDGKSLSRHLLSNHNVLSTVLGSGDTKRPHAFYCTTKTQALGKEFLMTPLLTLCICLLPNKTGEEGSSSHLSCLPSVSVSNPPLNTPLINFLIKLPCSHGFFLLPLRHSQASQSHVCSPLPLTSLSLWLHSQAFKGIMFLCSAGLTKHAPWCLTAQPSNRQLSLSALPSSSFLLCLMNAYHSFRFASGPSPPASLPWPPRLVWMPLLSACTASRYVHWEHSFPFGLCFLQKTLNSLKGEVISRSLVPSSQ